MAPKDTKVMTPLHVAIIMDGNGRWAKSRGWPRLVGHRRGAERVKQIVQSCPDIGIKYLTIYAFSTENWKRSTEEVLGLMTLFSRYIEREAEGLNERGVRMRFIGDRSALDARLRRLMDGIEERTAANDTLHLTVAINYGGRNEMARATRALCAAVARGDLRAEDVTETLISRFLDTSGIPDPDLVIRTSGETRISNYLLWQSAYAEYEFTQTLWPDFSSAELGEIVGRFALRDRRFGSVAT